MSYPGVIVTSMTSLALRTWRDLRVRHLDDLLIAHRLVRGQAPGRRRRMAAVNAALVLRLAAEFQGFVRDLHDEACDVFVAWIAPGNTIVQQVTDGMLRFERALDRGNATPGAIGRDFGRLGLRIWGEMNVSDRRARGLNQSLERLIAVRNALAHADDAKLAALREMGCGVLLGTFHRWRRDLDELARMLDAEVGSWIGKAFNRESPW